MTIEQLIYRHAQNSPSKIAIISGEKEVSYQELWNKILNSANFFKSQNLKKGSRIIISASKNIDFVYAYFGVHLSGYIGVPIDPEINELRLQRIVDSATPALIVGELRNKGTYEVLPFSAVCSEKPLENVVFPEENQIADLLFTTGTMGLPKGVSLSFYNEYCAAENINTFIQNTADDIELLALPVSHSFGLGRLRCVLTKGATLVLLGSFASMKKFFGEMERCHVTGFGMVPASWAYIAKMSGDKIAQFASQLRYIEIGSSFMPRAEKEKLLSYLPLTRICMHYGLTEASRSTFIHFKEDYGHLDTIGKPSPNTEIAFFDEKGNRLPQGEEGELCVKGGHVCSSYWGQTQEAFARDFWGEYFKTGDWGYEDEDHYLHLISRKKEMINVGGKKVSPIEVEEALNAIEGIEESACIGVPDAVMGEVVKAFVVGTLTSADDERIKKEIALHLENYKVPVFVEHIDAVPKTSSGKMQRLLLKKN